MLSIKLHLIFLGRIIELSIELLLGRAQDWPLLGNK